jgi:hypothetical protein
VRQKVAEDVTKAAKEANVQTTALLLDAFVQAATRQTAAFTQVYATVPKDQRVARLAKYLTAKVNVRPGSTSLTGKDLGDFHWGYIARDTKYAPLRLESSEPAKLLTVESTGVAFDFSVKSESIKPGTVILFPTAPGQEGGNVSAAFELGNRKALWSGDLTGGNVKVVSATTSRGCEIFINSTPTKATVYFNDKKWYERTNTSAVRDPGSWEVKMRLTGYKEHVDHRNLLAGESWTINALLTRQ